MHFGSVSDAGAQLRAQLTRERDRVLAELRAYPPAVPACDAQFNYLLEQRDGLGRELGRLDAILDADADAQLKARRLADFLRNSAFLNADPAAP